MVGLHDSIFILPGDLGSGASRLSAIFFPQICAKFAVVFCDSRCLVELFRLRNFKEESLVADPGLKKGEP